MSVVWDEEAPGLHAESCSCLRCESGFRPTMMERWRAREQHRRSQQMVEAFQKKPSREELRRAERRRLAAEADAQRRADEARWRRLHAPLSQEQIKQLEELKAREFPALARSGRR